MGSSAAQFKGAVQLGVETAPYFVNEEALLIVSTNIHGNLLRKMNLSRSSKAERLLRPPRVRK